MNRDWDDDDARTVAYFTDRLARHGASPLAVDWGSEASQQLRFAVLLEVGVRPGDSLIDVGCGAGGLYGWQKERRMRLDYRGVDLTPGMIAAAHARYPEARFAVCNVLSEDAIEPADFVVASGLFYLRQSDPKGFMSVMLARLWSLARTGVAVNCLSAWASEHDDCEFYAEPAVALSIARSLTPHVVLRHDYHPRDFTLYLRRQAFRSS